MLTEQNSTVWPYVMEPGDEVDFRAQFTLDTDEAIAAFELRTDAESTALGLEIGTGVRQPLLVEDDTALLVWFSIDPAMQNDPAFDSGALVGFVAVITTNSGPPRRYERAFSVFVKQGAK